MQETVVRNPKIIARNYIILTIEYIGFHESGLLFFGKELSRFHYFVIVNDRQNNIRSKA
jgi:hypothetical protein